MLGRVGLSDTNQPTCGPMELLDKLNLQPGTFDGRVAVVTGAARGIGEHVAKALAHLGAHTIILDIRETGDAVADQIRASGGFADFWRVDLTDLEALDAIQR